MSLINQVLQDLEKRHASEPELKSLPPHVRTVVEQPRASRSFASVAVTALLIVVFAALAIHFSGLLRPAPQPPVAAPPMAPSPPAPAAPAAAASETETVQAQLLAPASRLSDELGFVPENRAPKEAAPKPPKPAPPRKPTQPRAAPEFRPTGEPVPPAAAPVTPEPASTTAPPVVAQASSAVAEKQEPVSAPAGDGPVVIEKQLREMTPPQRAELAFRKGVSQLQEARAAAAEKSFREALQEDPTHAAARQALLGLLLDSRRNEEAEQLLRRALEMNPRQPRHAMVLARLEVDRGEVTGAINTLVAALPYVQSDAEYYAFLAALLQREERHRDAIDYYRTALRQVPGSGLWWMGLGISLRATSQLAEAREAFQRAIDSRQLSGDLLAFTERQLRDMSTPRK